jgi:rRNA-processing protein FCF1
MIDSNIFDKLDQDPTAIERISKLVNAGVVQIFITSVQRNQLNNISDITKRDRLLSIVHRLNMKQLPVEYAPYGYAYGECYGGLSLDVVLDTNKFVSSLTQIEDAMIAATASSSKYDLDFVVTEDVGFQKRLRRQSIVTQPISWSKFCSEIINQ